MILNFLLKCADLSNVAKPRGLNDEWSNRVSDEFFTQADYERSHKYPVAPHMDRTKTNRPRIAADFMDFVATPMFRVLSEFLPQSGFLMDYIQQNRAAWQKGLDELTKQAQEAKDEKEAKEETAVEGEGEDEVVDLNEAYSEDEGNEEGENEGDKEGGKEGEKENGGGTEIAGDMEIEEVKPEDLKKDEGTHQNPDGIVAGAVKDNSTQSFYPKDGLTDKETERRVLESKIAALGIDENRGKEAEKVASEKVAENS